MPADYRKVPNPMSEIICTPTPADLDSDESILTAQLRQAMTERDAARHNFEALRREIGLVAAQRAARNGWSQFSGHARDLVEEVGGIWPESKSFRVTVTITHTLELETFDVDAVTRDGLTDMLADAYRFTSGYVFDHTVQHESSGPLTVAVTGLEEVEK